MNEHVVSAAMRHLDRICDFGGRLSGSAGEARALDYIRGVFEGCAAGPIATHKVAYDGWRCKTAAIELDGKSLPMNALPGSTSLPGGVAELEIIDAGRGTLDELDALAERIKGNALMVRHEFMFAPDHLHRSKKVARALEHGAALFVIANTDPESGLVTGGATPAMPAMGISYETAAALSAAGSAGRPARFTLSTEIAVVETDALDFLIPARSTGSDTKEIIVCAHIDGHAISESALDNATGVAVLLALAEHYAHHPLENLDLRFLVFSAEEMGLCGSDRFVEELPADGRDRIKAVVNLDCIAGSPSFGAITNGFDTMVDLAVSAGKAEGISMKIHNELVRNSDHYAFAAAGIPALRLTSGFGLKDSRLRYVLTERDNRELVERNEMETASRLVNRMIGALAT